MKTKAMSDQELEQAKDQMLNLFSEDKMNFQDELCNLIYQARFEKMSDEDILNQIAAAIKIEKVRPELSRENILAYTEKNVPRYMGSKLIQLIKAVREFDNNIGLNESKNLVEMLFTAEELRQR